MRLSIIKIVFLKELREMLRDRRSLTIMFGIPLVLYPLLTILIGTIGFSKKKQLTDTPARVVVMNPAAAPHLMELFEAKDSGVQLQTSAEPEKELASGKLDAMVVVPLGAETDALEGRSPGEITIKLDRSRTQSGFAEGKISKILSSYDRWIVEQRLKAHGQSVDLLQPLKRNTTDIATADQRFGKMLAMSLPVLLLLTGMLGALFPALNATTTERELGTLETLLVTPAGRMELLVAKGALVLLSGLLTAGLNMISMSLVIWRSLSLIESSMGTLTINLHAMALTYLAAVPTLITFTTLVLIIGLLARTFREANHLATPIMMIPLAAMLVGVAEPDMTPALLVTPVANTTLIIREALTGRVTPGPFVLAFISSTVYAGLLLSAAAKLFSNEQLVNPAWEPVSLKGLRPRNFARPTQWRLPGVDEALALFSVALLLSFYIAPSLQSLGFVPLILIQQIGLLAGPALVLAWVGKYRWVETFSFRRPTFVAMLGGLLLGIGLVPWMQQLHLWQMKVWEPNREQQSLMLKLLIEPIAQWPILMPMLIGVLAGTCEEILFRGPIQKGLLRRLPVWPAILIASVLFAAAHLDLYGLPIRTLLGVILGWMVVRTGSIFPAMLMHGVYDIVSLLQLSYEIRVRGTNAIVEAASKPQTESVPLWMLGVGVVLIGLAMSMLLSRKSQRTVVEA